MSNTSSVNVRVFSRLNTIMTTIRAWFQMTSTCLVLGENGVNHPWRSATWASSWSPPSPFSPTSNPSLKRPSSTWRTSPDSGNTCLTLSLRLSSFPSFPPVWTTAMESCSGYQTRPWTNSSTCSTQLPGFSPAPSLGSASRIILARWHWLQVKSRITYRTKSSCSPTNHFTAQPPSTSGIPSINTPHPELEGPLAWASSLNPVWLFNPGYLQNRPQNTPLQHCLQCVVCWLFTSLAVFVQLVCYMFVLSSCCFLSYPVSCYYICLVEWPWVHERRYITLSYSYYYQVDPLFTFALL